MFVIKLYYHIMAIIKKIFYKIIYGKHIKFGKGVTFRRGFSLVIEDDAIVKIGDGCFFNNYCSINAKSSITIGNNCLFGENVKIYDHNHRFNIKDELIKKQGYTLGKIEIGNNCWFGSNVIILRNTIIGNNNVVGANEVVRKNIGDNNLYVKNEINNIIWRENNA